MSITNHAPPLAYICSLVAVLPDSAWWYRYIFPEKLGTKPPPKMNRFNSWHSSIQTSETIRPGIAIEVTVAICLGLTIAGPLL